MDLATVNMGVALVLKDANKDLYRGAELWIIFPIKFSLKSLFLKQLFGFIHNTDQDHSTG